MDDNMGATYVTITDDEGNEHELEFIMRLTCNGRDYSAFFPADAEGDDAYKIIMFRIVEENGEELLETIDNDDEAEEVYEAITQRLFDEDDEDDEEDGE